MSFQFQELTTERLVLRQLCPQDGPALSILRSDDGVNAFIQRPKQTSLDGALVFIEKINGSIGEHKCFYWAVSLKGEPNLIGTVCLFNFSINTSAELGYELSPDFQNRGIANEAVKAVIGFAFNTVGFRTLEACVHRDNSKSVNLLLRNNFIPDANRKVENLADYNFFVLNA